MDLYFAGAENPGWRELLAAQGIRHMEVSFSGVARRRRTSYGLSSYDLMDVLLNSGAYTYNKEGAEAPNSQVEEAAAAYVEYLRDNAAYVRLFTDFDALQMGYDWIKRHRETVLERIAPDKIMPIWHPEYGLDELRRLCAAYSYVGITEDGTKTDMASMLNALVSQHGVHLHGVAMTKTNIMQRISWASCSSMSWLSPAHYGDTIWWSGHKLHRYPVNYKDQARKRHRVQFEQAGFDPAKITADDSVEILKASIWSFHQFAKSMDRVTQPLSEVTGANTESQGGPVAISPDQARNSGTSDDPPLPRRVIPPRERDRLPLPGIDIEETEERYLDDDGSPASRTLSLVHATGSSLRACDACFIKARCPGFEAGAACVYEIPARIRTRDQLRAVQDTLVEIQFQRVAFLRLCEDLEGGYSDQNLSGEIDRLNRLVAARQKMNENAFSLKIESREQGGPGIFTRIFGGQAGDKLQALDAPIPSDDLMNVLAGEVVSEPASRVE